MVRTIKIRELSASGEEIKQVGLEEARLMLKDAVARGWIVVDAKKKELIWEIGENVEEIIIMGILGGG